MPRGGKREGAGRPPKAEKHARPIAAAEKKFADRLPALAALVLQLAQGGSANATEVWEAAGLLQIDDFENVGTDERPMTIKVKRPAFPNKKPEELVLIKRTVPPPNLAALIYALDRIMGRPTERQEHSGPDGAPIPVSVDGAIERVYGEPPPPAAEAE